MLGILAKNQKGCSRRFTKIEMEMIFLLTKFNHSKPHGIGQDHNQNISFSQPTKSLGILYEPGTHHQLELCRSKLALPYCFQ